MRSPMDRGDQARQTDSREMAPCRCAREQPQGRAAVRRCWTDSSDYAPHSSSRLQDRGCGGALKLIKQFQGGASVEQQLCREPVFPSNPISQSANRSNRFRPIQDVRQAFRPARGGAFPCIKRGSNENKGDPSCTRSCHPNRPINETIPLAARRT